MIGGKDLVNDMKALKRNFENLTKKSDLLINQMIGELPEDKKEIFTKNMANIKKSVRDGKASELLNLSSKIMDMAKEFKNKETT